ncbi:MAG: prolipoprotein diacylglyceryl transferase [Gemmataceae bacterium]|nr:prolipoprotein diacylglyceryl transferase [Gemmataceae bacterium]
MRQILFHIPLIDLPIYGYGFMLFCAFIACTFVAVRLARREGVPREPIQDLTVWLFVTGIIGARVTFIVQHWGQFNNIWQFFAVWDGGLVFYGSAFGGIIGYLCAYHLQLKKYGISHWKMLDIAAPCIALGLCLGRVGCLLNGCCYGNVACGHCWGVQFPTSSPPRAELVARGYQTPTGFLTIPNTRIVGVVEPMSAAAKAGLVAKDTIEEVKVDGRVVDDDAALDAAYGLKWNRGERTLELAVTAPATRTVGPFAPLTLGLHPTQVYESISMALLLFLLVSLYPYKTRDGVLMVIFMFGYGVHRFLNEMLRIDNERIAFGMTFSQIVSIGVVAGALLLAAVVWLRPASTASPAADAGADTAADAATNAAASAATPADASPPAATTAS